MAHTQRPYHRSHHTHTPHSVPSAALHQPESCTAEALLPHLAFACCRVAAPSPRLAFWGSHGDYSTRRDESWVTPSLQSSEGAAGRELGRQRCAVHELPRAGAHLPALKATRRFLSPCRVSLARELGQGWGSPQHGWPCPLLLYSGSAWTQAVIVLGLSPSQGGRSWSDQTWSVCPQPMPMAIPRLKAICPRCGGWVATGTQSPHTHK